MLGEEYALEYLPLFSEELSEAVRYISVELKNPDAAAIVDVKWRLARRKAAVEWALTKTALSAQSKAVYRAYVMEGRPIGDVAAKFNIARNSVSQIKTRVERMVAAIENEF